MMSEQIKVELIKKMSYERVSCVCGMAVFSRDPTPKITEIVKNTAKKHKALFTLIDVNVHPEVMKKYGIEELPVVIINEKVYPADAETIKDVLNQQDR
jgi:hypothetical protein